MRASTLTHTHTHTDMITYHKSIQYLWLLKPAGQQKTMPCTTQENSANRLFYIPEVTAQLSHYISLGFFNYHNEMPPDQLKQLHKVDVAFRIPGRSHGYMTKCFINAKRANAISCHQGAHETQTAIEMNKHKVAGLLTWQFGVRRLHVCKSRH